MHHPRNTSRGSSTLLPSTAKDYTGIFSTLLSRAEQVEIAGHHLMSSGKPGSDFEVSPQVLLVDQRFTCN
jgi:hypothetical protein